MRRLLPFLLLGFFALPASATNIYFANSAVGGNTGADCANARAYTTHAIGDDVAGNVMHVCGTWTGAVGATAFTFLASGTSGNPITLLFETNAVLTSPAWGSASTAVINCNSKAFITIDGGTNGIIQNTANGNGLANTQSTWGIDGSTVGCSNFTVQNLHFNNLFVRIENTPSATQGANTIAILLRGSNSLAKNNTVVNSRYAVYTGVCGQSNIEIANNKTTFTENGVLIGTTNGTGCASTGFLVHDNDIGDGAYVWDQGTTDNSFHHDPIHLFGELGGVKVYNNYIHGTWGKDTVYKTYSGGTHITSMIYLETLQDGAYVFNNVMAPTGGVLTQPDVAFIDIKGSGTAGQLNNNAHVYNNTMVDDYNGSSAISCSNGSGNDFRNNIAVNTNTAFYCAASSITTSDYNVFYQVVEFGNNFNNWTGWRGLGFDAHSSQATPNLSAAPNFVPVATSSAIATGTNLTSLGITALDSDKNGNARGATWDIGAIKSGSTGGPATPTNISIVVVGP